MKRLLLLAALVAGFVIVSKLLVEDFLGLGFAPWVATWVTEARPASAFVIVGLLAVDLFLPVPSSFVMLVSGAIFGTAVGAALSLLGSVGGEWLGFELVRRYGRRASRHIVGEQDIRHLEHMFAKYGAVAVVVTRALPVVMETMSMVAGLSGMKRRTFLSASMLGTVPVVIAYAYAGSVSREVGSLVPAVVMLIALAGGAFAWYRARVAHVENETEPVA